jgi:hypothetical protein
VEVKMMLADIIDGGRLPTVPEIPKKLKEGRVISRVVSAEICTGSGSEKVASRVASGTAVGA